MSSGMQTPGEYAPISGGSMQPQFGPAAPSGDDESGEVVRQMNAFLRGEISAAETYKMAMEKLSESDYSIIANVEMLREVQAEHGRAAQIIRERIRELGGQPADSSGAWGAWAKFAMGTAKLFGEAAALKSLKDGEEHGLRGYRSGADDVDTASAQLIHNQLIPSQLRHINLLETLIDAVGTA